jgi:carbon monoxide dehydrogenase subunit G
MEVSASYTFTAPPAIVWTLLIDPEVVGTCLPGCERLEPLGDDRYRAELKLAVASVSGQYSGTVTILDKKPPHSYRLVVDGSGKPGFVRGEVVIELVGQPDETTTVHVKGDGQVGGLIARVGQRLLGSVSKMMMDRFFACLQQKVENS